MTNIKYCESYDKYKYSNIVSEYFNSLSTLSFIIVGLIGLSHRLFINKLVLSEIGIIFVGLGSFIFHSTTTYNSEIIDELSMIFLLFTYILHINSSFLFKIGLTSAISTMSLLYFYYNYYIIFFLLIFLSISLLIYFNRRNKYNKQMSFFLIIGLIL